MCGIISFFGQFDGLVHVMESLHLLEYRSPDSTGAAALDENGHLAVRRSVGTPAKLIQRMAEAPLFRPIAKGEGAILQLLGRQNLPYQLDSLRDLSDAPIGSLYDTPGLRVGLGDRGRLGAPPSANYEARFSSRLCATIEAAGSAPSPDFDPDPVRHAFRLVGGHMASRIDIDPDLRRALNHLFRKRAPEHAYPDWQTAWRAEAAANTPGLAFAVAVRRFQETFPGLADHLDPGDWERFGGLTAQAMAQVVIGHGRWATVGPATETNAHPFRDRSGKRLVCENGSHNARVLLNLKAEQRAWWQARGDDREPVHLSDNTTEVIALEWERTHIRIEEGALAKDEQVYLKIMASQGVEKLDEQALRLTLRKLREGNAHACTFFNCSQPGRLFVSSHDKPIAIAIRRVICRNGLIRSEVMVASDINAALMLWPGPEVDRAAAQLADLDAAGRRGEVARSELERRRKEILAAFTVDAIFLDADIHQGRELLASIQNRIEAGQVVPEVTVTRYDGTPLAVAPRQINLNPNMVGKRGFPTFIESHLDEIPDVMDELVRVYMADHRVKLDSVWQEGETIQPGLNVTALQKHFGSQMAGLQRLLLVGEGSSWRVAQAAAPLLRGLLPGVLVVVYRPVELLNIGPGLLPSGDLAVEISWSGTTDSLLKVDRWLEELGVMRLVVTGRPWSDLGRRASRSAGTLDVHTGIEVSVATVKGYQGLLMTCFLIALQFADMQAGPHAQNSLQSVADELSLVVPAHVRALVNDTARREHIRAVTQRCGRFNKFVVVGDSPINIEGELKIEELAQVVAAAFDFQTTSLRALIERSALMEEDTRRILFVINASTPRACLEARPFVNYLRELDVVCLVHTTDPGLAETWNALSNTEAFLSMQVDEALQPLIDAIFFYDLAIGLAYARGLPPEVIDRPRNLAKSITITGAERRAEVESRREFWVPALEEFAAGGPSAGRKGIPQGDSELEPFRSTVALRSALSVISESPPEVVDFGAARHLVVMADSEATENGAAMAAAVWGDLLGIDVTVYRSYLSELPEVGAGSALFQIIRAGALLTIREGNILVLPDDLSPLQQEMLTSVYLIGLAVRRARAEGAPVDAWEAGLLRLPVLLADLLSDEGLERNLMDGLRSYVTAGYDKFHVIGGGQDHLAALSISRSLRRQGLLAEGQYTDSAWHGPLAAVGGGDADHDTLIMILANDPLFQAAAMVDTQVYRTRHAPVFLVVPQGNQDLPVVQGVQPQAILPVPAVPRPFIPLIGAALGKVLARAMSQLEG